jgi:hypothetical protein
VAPAFKAALSCSLISVRLLVSCALIHHGKTGGGRNGHARAVACNGTRHVLLRAQTTSYQLCGEGRMVRVAGSGWRGWRGSDGGGGGVRRGVWCTPDGAAGAGKRRHLGAWLVPAGPDESQRPRKAAPEEARPTPGPDKSRSPEKTAPEEARPTPGPDKSRSPEKAAPEGAWAAPGQESTPGG